MRRVRVETFAEEFHARIARIAWAAAATRAEDPGKTVPAWRT